jgi:hypothetical protein
MFCKIRDVDGRGEVNHQRIADSAALGNHG